VSWYRLWGVAGGRTVKVKVFERGKAKVTARIVIQRIPGVLTSMLGGRHSRTGKKISVKTNSGSARLDRD